MYVISLKMWYNVYSRYEWHYRKDEWCHYYWQYLGVDDCFTSNSIKKLKIYKTLQGVERHRAYFLENTPLEHIGNIEFMQNLHDQLKLQHFKQTVTQGSRADLESLTVELYELYLKTHRLLLEEMKRNLP